MASQYGVTVSFDPENNEGSLDEPRISPVMLKLPFGGDGIGLTVADTRVLVADLLGAIAKVCRVSGGCIEVEPQGHIFTPNNTLHCRGHRRCRTCHSEKERARRARKHCGQEAL